MAASANHRDIPRLADDLRKAILANEEVLSRTAGRIQVDIYPRSSGFDIKVTVTLS